jgi:hypothetical protein
MRCGRLFVHLCVLLFSASAATLVAQEPLPFEGEAAERIEQYKKIRLMDFLKLDEETSIRFFSRYNRFVEDLKAINGKKNASIDELQNLVRRDASDAEFQKVFDQLDALGGELQELRRQYLEDLSRLLPTKKVASYIVFERNFYRNLRELLRESARGRPGRGPG